MEFVLCVKISYEYVVSAIYTARGLVSAFLPEKNFHEMLH
jgi:hypothetical protein